MRASSRPAVFLDRDGTLIEDVGHLGDPTLVRLLESVAQGLAQLGSAGYLLVMVSNQSGIGRGLLTVEQVGAVNAELGRQLAREGVRLDGAYICPHTPDEGCDCRKPNPGMLRRAAADLDVDLTRSFLVGDQLTDVRAGHSAGCRAVLLSRDAAAPGGPIRADAVTHSWPEVVAWILNHGGPQR